MKTAIINGRIILPEGIANNVNIIFQDEKIISIIPRDEELSNVDAIIDAKNHYISAGFIDIHTHGGGGFDFMDGDVDSFIGATTFHMEHGTTSIVPTTLSGSDDEMFNLFKGFENTKKIMKKGPEILGLHLEGPYFSMEQKGAQDPKFIKNPTPEAYNKILDACSDIIRWSIAPELRGAMELGDELKKRNIMAAIGHTDAVYDDVLKAVKHGYTHVTHLYSGMSTIKRINAFRVLGVTECAYLFDELTVEIIADGKHLPPELLSLIVKCKPIDKICLITDSLRCAGENDGVHFSGSKQNGQKVIVEDGVAKMPDRTCFAGSVCTSDRCIRTMNKLAGVDLVDSIKMMTINPARFMKVDSRKGSIEVGKDADFCIFNEDIQIKSVICKGNIMVSNL